MLCGGELDHLNQRTVLLQLASLLSSDVLSQNRVNVSEEKSERVIWYKVRVIRRVHMLPDPDTRTAGEVPDG